MSHLNETLSELGLSQKEITVLLALYSLNKATVAELARKSGMPRTTIYTALNALQRKDVLMRVQVGKRELWKAISPKELLARKQLQVSALKKLVPELEQLVATADQTHTSSIMHYKGTQGMQCVYDMILTLSKGERVYGFEGGRSSQEKFTRLPNSYSCAWQDAVKRKGIILEVVISEALLDHIRTAPKELSEAAYGRLTITSVLPHDVMNFDSDILVFGNHIAIITPKTLNAVVITDPIASMAFKQLIKTACAMGRKIDLNAFIKQHAKI